MTTGNKQLDNLKLQRKIEKKYRVFQQMLQKYDLINKHKKQKAFFIILIISLELLAIFLNITRVFILEEPGS
jgi:hypothetical protein